MGTASRYPPKKLISAEIARLDEKGAVELGILLLESVGKHRGATRLLIAERGGEVWHGGDSGGDELEVFLCHGER